MSQLIVDFGPSLKELGPQDWMAEVEELVSYDGYFERLGPCHAAAFTEHGKTLLVSFETRQGIMALSPAAQPLGWDLVKSKRWSSLTLISDGDTWFRDPAVYDYFDRLVDNGFFEGFDSILFYGAGPCGHAAAAFSVVAPGANVLALQPQATLAPELTEWDRRFPEQRRADFKSRFGYAPDMVETASEVFIVYDPTQIEDAMHVSLFTKPNVTRLRMRRLGASLQADLQQMGILLPLIRAAGSDRLTPTRFAVIARARRDHAPYLRRLLAQVEERGGDDLVRLLCRNVTGRMTAPRFARRLASLTFEPA